MQVQSTLCASASICRFWHAFQINTCQFHVADFCVIRLDLSQIGVNQINRSRLAEYIFSHADFLAIFSIKNGLKE